MIHLDRRSFVAAAITIGLLPAKLLISPAAAAGRTLKANPSNISAVLSTALPGDRISLASGTYSGSKLVIGCTDVQIVAEALLGPKFTCDIAMIGSGVILAGIDAWRSDLAGGTSVAIAGKNNHLIRSRVFRRTGHCIDLIGQGCSVRYCDVSIWGKMETPKVNGNLLSSSTNFALIHDSGSKGRLNVIERCWLHDGPLKVAGSYQHYGITGVGVGINPTNFSVESGLTILACLFDNTGDCEISIKTSRNRIIGCTVTGDAAVNKCYGNQRSGNYNEWLCNWFDPTRYGMSLVIHGGYHKAIKNYCAQNVALRYGNFDWNVKPSGETRHHRAYACHMAENVGTVRYGQRYSSESALRLPPTLCEFSNQKWTAGGGTLPRIVNVNHDDIPAAVRLTRDAVGPGAPV